MGASALADYGFFHLNVLHGPDLLTTGSSTSGRCKFMSKLTRRQFLLILLGFLSLEAAPAYAKKGGNGGNDDDDDDGNSGHGNDDDGYDDDNSGHGSGGDDDDDDDTEGGDNNDKRGNGKAKKARDAVKKNKAATLKEILRLVRNRYPGRVIKVDVSGGDANLIYTIKLIDENNRRMQIRVNANQRRIVGAQFI
jgi:uncharacterized membrane protein YkoI